MLEFYSWPSYAPSARYSPTSRHADKEGWEPKAAGQRRTEEGLKRFSQRDFEEWSSQIPGSLVGGASLPPDAQKTCCGEIGRLRSQTDSASSDSALFTLSRYPIVPAQRVHCVCAPCSHCVHLCSKKHGREQSNSGCLLQSLMTNLQMHKVEGENWFSQVVV